MKSQPYAVVTGAASGLGLALARRLAFDYRLILVDRNEVALEEQWGHWDGHYTLVADLTDRVAIDHLIEHIRSLTGEVALLVNNAGITHRSLSYQTDSRVLEAVMAVDYLAPVLLAQGLLTALENARGKVVNIGSMAGWMPVAGRAGYCAAKSALHQYFETFRAEVAHKDVSVLMVYPSFLDTPIETNALDGKGGKASHARSMVGKMRTGDWMAEKIEKAIKNNKQRLFPDHFTAFAAILYRLWPSLYLRLMTRKFASELAG
ncbi:Aklaviketone reductase DauE [Saliniradius amylolyticus]|uniref:Aklaviketone reductase DauE n=1 Tax=Saliniradius amylolyticus TaxID=2183582 RepID=A0A2S2E3F6_9ALTE|nr:SDR family NAD(P)-dependent oxidoreductase [Saliniradius amylolyticus]AWL12178.1 Aklaviketone reductase DauE [Saliniradius amylolyticus]